jgi:hypothetical protein
MSAGDSCLSRPGCPGGPPRVQYRAVLASQFRTEWLGQYRCPLRLASAARAASVAR